MIANIISKKSPPLRGFTAIDVESSFFASISLMAAVLLTLFSVPAYPQSAPYIDGDVIAYGIETVPRSDSSTVILQRLCVFKVVNPDTVPFYLWVTLDNGGVMEFVSQRGSEYPPLRLVDLELRYKDDLSRPAVKKLPLRRSFVRAANRRLGGSGWRGAREAKRGAKQNGRNAKQNPERWAERVDTGTEIGVDGVTVEAESDRGVGAVEVVFWKEDAQGYYEMELWGAVYPPDMRKALAGRYTGSVKFEIEAMR